MAGHAEVETFSVRTRLPGDARIDRTDAIVVLTRGLEPVLHPDPESADSPAVRIAVLGISGGAVVDALVALAALDNGATLMTRDQLASVTFGLLAVAGLVLAATPWIVYGIGMLGWVVGSAVAGRR